MKKRINIRFIVLLLVGMILLILLSSFLFRNKSYSVDYKVNDYKISENYDSSKSLYYFEISYNDVVYPFVLSNNYYSSKKLIKRVVKHSYEDYVCLEVISNEFDYKDPLCSNKSNVIDRFLVPDELLDELSIGKSINKGNKVDNYIIYNSDNKEIIWNYKGIDIVSNKIDKINIFDKDIYNVSLNTVINGYYVVADYSSEYFFNKVYIVDLDKKKLDEWELDYEISFDSYILGVNDRSIFIVDRKNKVEYELVPHRKAMRVVGYKNGLIYENGFKKISINKLVNSKYTFKRDSLYNYELLNNKLYLRYGESKILVRVSYLDVDKIVDINKDSVYYLVNDSLYRYNLKDGEVKIISYYEWNYNNENMIFIY